MFKNTFNSSIDNIFKPKNENLQTDYEDSPTTIFRKPKINENVAASASRTDNTGELR